MFIVALFTVAKTLWQPKCPLIDEGKKKMWGVCVCVCVCVCVYISSQAQIEESMENH